MNDYDMCTDDSCTDGLCDCNYYYACTDDTFAVSYSYIAITRNNDNFCTTEYCMQ